MLSSCSAGKKWRLSAAEKQIPIYPDRPRIWVLDRAYHDKAFWSRMKRERATIVIIRMKKGMTPIRYGQMAIPPLSAKQHS